MADDGNAIGCGCGVVILGLWVAFMILCVGVAWRAISWAWGWSFGGGV